MLSFVKYYVIFIRLNYWDWSQQDLVWTQKPIFIVLLPAHKDILKQNKLTLFPHHEKC